MVKDRDFADHASHETPADIRATIIARAHEEPVRRSDEPLEKKSAGRSRRSVIIQTAAAILATISGGIVSKALSAQPSKIGFRTGLWKMSRETAKLSAPTPAEYVKLGEHMSYVSHLPSGARIFDVTSAIGGILNILRDRDLPETRAAAKSLWGLRAHNGIGSYLLSEESKPDFAEKMIPIRRALEAELARRS